MAADGDTLGTADLSADIVKGWNDRPRVPVATSPAVSIRLDQTLEQAMRELEQMFIEHAMGAAGGRVAEAAELLGISRKGLFLKRRRQRPPKD